MNLGQCQAMGHIDNKAGFIPHDVRCKRNAEHADPRGPKLCWVHHKAFNNPNRRPLHLYKSADCVPR